MTTSSRAPKHVWNKEEEDTLVECLVQLVSTRGWKSDNEMQGPLCIGFGSNEDERCIIVEKEVFGNWVRSHPAVKGLFNKPFSYYDELAYVFGCYKVTGHFVETFVDVGSNEPIGYEGFDMPSGNEDFPSSTARGLTCPRRMYTHHDLLAHQRVGSDRVDRRGRGEASERASFKSHIWFLSVRTTNSGRLRSGLHAPLLMTTMCSRNSYAYCVRCQN
ncbi:retrotransposon protein [Cucumis melo var. makuwa]|uniref:Retrotransposon protein n=1 Tax=Cucumis melo var. makuwa TaxID=1194695 RepID=A0A5D3DHQ9_CUCMM|nr:retrotransposon protein [Cucumis melo var. makuwa]